MFEKTIPFPLTYILICGILFIGIYTAEGGGEDEAFAVFGV